MNDLVIVNTKKEAVTTSRILAEKFGKRHDTITRIVNTLKKDDKETYNALNIAAVKYIDAKGEKRLEYRLNRDAYAFFAMGFTGKQANKFKIEFIKAFNEMETWITQRVKTSVEYQVMSSILKDSRELAGKETKPFHYANEAKLINWVMSGEFKPLDREGLTADEIELLNDLQARNAVLIGAGMTRNNRKESLRVAVELKRRRLVEQAA